MIYALSFLNSEDGASFANARRQLLMVAMFALTVPLPAHAEDVYLLPQWDGGVDTSGRFNLEASDGRASLNAEFFAPLSVNRSVGIFFHGGLSYSRFDINDNISQGGTAFAGLVWRKALDDSWVLGTNFYVDAASVDDAEDFMSGLSLGLELQRIGQSSILTSGANYYLPKEDYTDPSRRGKTNVALREGFDLYSRFEWLPESQWTFGVEGSVYDYQETRFAEEEAGWRLELQAGRRGLGLAGNGITARIGLRSDWDGDTDVVAGLQYEMSFGESIARVSTRSKRARQTQQRSTLASIGGGKIGNTPVSTQDPVVSRPARTKSQRLRPPTRYLGLGSPLVNIREKAATAPAATTAQLQVLYALDVSDGIDGENFAVDASIDQLDAVVPTGRVSGTLMASDISASSVSFDVTDIPPSFSGPSVVRSISVACTDRGTGGVAFSQIFAGPGTTFQIPLTPGDDIDCRIEIEIDIV